VCVCVCVCVCMCVCVCVCLWTCVCVCLLDRLEDNLVFQLTQSQYQVMSHDIVERIIMSWHTCKRSQAKSYQGMTSQGMTRQDKA
jgi:hypothetical protein